jgi:hypothetical protein
MPRELVEEMINLIQFTIEDKLNFVESKGQNEWRQTILAKIHPKKEMLKGIVCNLTKGA